MYLNSYSACTGLKEKINTIKTINNNTNVCNSEEMKKIIKASINE